MSYHVGDDYRTVGQNREEVARAVSIETGSWILCQQVHGTRISEVGELEVGRGGRDYNSAMPRTDALLTGLEGAALAVLTADCMPIILVAPVSRVVAAVHAGWRGTLWGICGKAARRLARSGGCGPDEVLAFIGPHIKSCCFEVSADTAAYFRGKYGAHVVSGGPEGRYLVDLSLTCRVQLEEAGVPVENIYDAGICTSCDGEYFSFRRSGGVTGRQAGMVALLGRRRVDDG